MTIKLYGYGLLNGKNLIELQEVTICVDQSKALALRDFFARCAEQMQLNPKWEHEHFQGDESADIIVFNCSKLVEK